MKGLLVLHYCCAVLACLLSVMWGWAIADQAPVDATFFFLVTEWIVYCAHVCREAYLEDCET